MFTGMLPVAVPPELSAISSPPALIFTCPVPVAKPVELLAISVPALMFVPPVYVFDVLIVTLPVPLTYKAPAPVMP